MFAMAMALLAFWMLNGSAQARDLRDCLKLGNEIGIVEYTCSVPATIAFCWKSYTLSSGASETQHRLAEDLLCNRTEFYHDPCFLSGPGRCNHAFMQAWAIGKVRDYETRWAICEGLGESIRVTGDNLYSCGLATTSRQETELDRSERQRIQTNLAAAGFDPGPADGVFGPRTRAAIRAWQEARGLEATGQLDEASVKALLATTPRDETERTAEGETDVEGVSEHAEVPLDTGAMEVGQEQAVPEEGQPTELEVTLHPKCSVEVYEQCWRAIANVPECHFWVKEDAAYSARFRPVDKSILTWSGSCVSGMAEGAGVLQEVTTSDDHRGEERWTGFLASGKQHGQWVEETFAPNGELSLVAEGSYIAGKRDGHWLEKDYWSDTIELKEVSAGAYIEGKRDGHWTIRQFSGMMGVFTFVQEGSYADGRRYGSWIYHNEFEDKCLERWEYSNGTRIDTRSC